MWAIFSADFNYDRRPRQAIAFAVPGGEAPQQWPRDVVDAAVKAGRAIEVPPPKRTKKPITDDLSAARAAFSFTKG